VPSPPFDLAQTDKLLTTTRSVRKRLDPSRPVDLSVVMECIDIALQAPTGGNTQQWRWLVVTDPDRRQALGELYRRAGEPYLAANRKALGGDISGEMDKVLSSAEHLAVHLGEMPVHVIPCALGTPPAEAGQGQLAGWYGSILPAAWSFMLAARSRGLGSAWTTLHLEHEAAAAELLGIPDSVSQVALLPVAHYTGEDFKPADRKPADRVTYLNGWGSREGL
jgi:nitroreductase